MAKKKEVTVEDKLRALYDLQLIDSRIDEIRNIRGELPLEIEDLEDEIAGMNTRISNLDEDVANLETDIKNKKNTIAEAGDLIKKYEAQQQKPPSKQIAGWLGAAIARASNNCCKQMAAGNSRCSPHSKR